MRIEGYLPHDALFLASALLHYRERKRVLKPPDSPADYSIWPFLETQSLFVHIPKCAGLSISRALYGCRAGGHMPLRGYQRLIRKRVFSRLFKFSFVRNPWDRLVSAYGFLADGGISERDIRFRNDVLSRYRDFEEFVLRGLDTVEVGQYPHFKSQVDFLKDHRGARSIDFIGSFETLQRDFEVVASRVKPDAELPILNRNDEQRNPRYREEFTARMAEKVFDVYREDIRQFGYDF